jgi:RHS repeat-associated protein
LYDELNRVQDKRLHASNYDGVSAISLASNFNYLQSLDYSYNIRGWLTSLNDPTSCAIQAGDQLADVFSMGLDYDSNANGATPQYNGNIAAMQWRTNVSGTCQDRQQYRFTYDFSNRLTAADHWTHNGTVWTNTNRYTESNITFDLNGNIKTYTRRGLVTAPNTYGVIDQLTYTYGDAARPDRLTNMSDAGSNAKGFFHTPAAAAYQYDLNGNMTQDNHKGFTFAYNFLNLPQSMTKGASVITMTYTADGEKLTKAVTGGGATKNYVAGIEYAGANLEAIYFGEGRCTPNGATAFNYDYTVKDHLGNARVNFRANGTTITSLESMHYYPFGMLMEGMGTNTPANDYTYNGKELNEDFALNWYDYGARWYDAIICRFPNIDPVIEKFTHLTPYNYASNNPITNIDLWGLQGVSMHALWNSMGFTGSGLNQIHEKIYNILPSDETRERINLAGNGLKTVASGTIGTAGAIGGLEFTGGVSITALPFTFGEIGVGGAQIYDAIFGENPFASKAIHKAGSLPGLLAYKNDSPYAEQIDAAGQFLPGTVAGGNFMGIYKAPKEIKSLVQAGKSAEAIIPAAGVVDAVLDIKGVVNSVTNNRPGRPRPEKSQLSHEFFESVVKKKSNIILKTTDKEDIKKFIDNLKEKK